MSIPMPSADSDPFNEPLAPLPAVAKDQSEAVETPRAVEAQAPAMEPEKFLPPEEDLELAVKRVAVERVEPEGELTIESSPSTPRWQFWKRPSKRDLQLETLRQGAGEMVSLMRSIRDHLEGEQGEREGIRRSLSPMPLAVEGLKSKSESQFNTGEGLGESRTTIERRVEKDAVFIKSLNRIGSTMANVEETFSLMDRTLSGIGESNLQVAKSMENLGEGVSESGRFMSETFTRLRDAEQEFTDHITRSSRRSNFALLGLCGILLLSVMAVGFMFKENRELLTAVQNNGALVVQVPVRENPTPERMAIFEDLDQVDDGIGELEREFVGIQLQGKKAAANIVPVGIEEKALLSVKKRSRRE